MQLLCFPAFFIEANMGEGVATPALLYMCRLSALFLVGLKGCLLTIQMKAPSLKPTAWLVAGTCWGSCLALGALNEPLFKKPEWYINLVIQSIFTFGFLLASLTAPSTAPKKSKSK